MAKVVYNDPEGVAETVTFFGHEMTAGQEIEVEDNADHQAFLDAADGNPFFTVSDRKKLEKDQENPPPVKYENRKLSPYDRGQLAKEEGKPRSVPVFYRGKDESEEWLKGYDGEPDAPAAVVSESPTSAAPIAPLSPGSSSSLSPPQGNEKVDHSDGA